MNIHNKKYNEQCPWIIIFSMVFVVFCTDVKISVVKISEICLLAYYFISRLSFNKQIKQFLIFFISFSLITLFHNMFLTFELSTVNNLLQRPYICTLGRFLEILSCLVFAQLVLNVACKYGIYNVFNRFFKCSCWLSILIIFLYGLFILGFKIPFINIVDKETLRLTGFYVEGGPFGLMCSSLTLLGIHLKRPKKEIAIFIILVLLAQSKAGLACILGYFCFQVIVKFYKKKIFRICLVLVVPLVCFIFTNLFLKIADQYINQMIDTDYLAAWVNANPEDYSSTAGRIPATFIIYNMFLSNPLFGIGIGNYPILRNLPEYRSFFPIIDIYDASGYGGFIDILNQCGIIGLVVFLFLLYKLKKQNKDSTYILLFCLPLLFGVQYTFAYPWLMLSLILLTKNESCNRLSNVG